jgi:hypothetical protein
MGYEEWEVKDAAATYMPETGLPAIQALDIAIHAPPIAIHAQIHAIQAPPIAIQAIPIAIQALDIAIQALPIAIQALTIATQALAQLRTTSTTRPRPSCSSSSLMINGGNRPTTWF